MNRDQALTKIKKCLSLAKSDNSHEAAAAMRQAQKLMSEFKVNNLDLTLIDVQEVRAKATSTAANVWEVRLVRMVAESFGCEIFGTVTGTYNSAGNYVRERFYVFVGVDAAPTVASYAYEVLSRQCAKSRLEHIRKQPKNCKAITKTSRGDEFAKGWVVVVADLIERFANPARDEALLLTYIQTKHPELGDGKVRDSTKGRKTDLGHRLAGYRAGADAQLHNGVGGVKQQEMLA